MKKIIKTFLKSSFMQVVLAWIGYGYLWFAFKTTRWHYIGFNHLKDTIQNDQPCIICFWHGRLAMMPFAWIWDKPFYMLLSEHGDGRLIARIIGYKKIRSIYGSSTRGGARAAIEAIRTIKKGYSIGITPDGPKGPRHHIADGLIHMARLTGAPIIPISYALSRRRFLKTWDNFLFPLPFGKGVYVAGELITVSNKINDDEFKAHKTAAKEALISTEIIADHYFKKQESQQNGH